MELNSSSVSRRLARPTFRRGSLSAHKRKASLGFADVGLFFVSVFFLSAVIRIAVHSHVLDQATADTPPLVLQTAISLFLISSLHLAVRLRHGPRAWALLGWTRPHNLYLCVALAGGIGLGMAVDFVARATTATSHFIHFTDLLLLDIVLGPLVEESFFRGCLLPVLARTMGSRTAILGAAALFATLHPVKTAVQWGCFAFAGIAYGWMRVKSGSTIPSAVMHAVYNAALYACQILSAVSIS